jgi:hypothetical protein
MVKKPNKVNYFGDYITTITHFPPSTKSGRHPLKGPVKISVKRWDVGSKTLLSINNTI